MSETTELHVRGMTCGGCVRSVSSIIAKTLGLERESIVVDLESGQATIPAAVTAPQLGALLEKLDAQGFPSTLRA